MDAVREAFPSMQAGDIIMQALRDIQSCYSSVANTRHICHLKPRSKHCADPTVQEGKYCAIRLNYVALICAAFDIDLSYLSIGGRVAMRNVIKNLEPKYFVEIEWCTLVLDHQVSIIPFNYLALCHC
jgi:hypothetical protein